MGQSWENPKPLDRTDPMPPVHLPPPQSAGVGGFPAHLPQQSLLPQASTSGFPQQMAWNTAGAPCQARRDLPALAFRETGSGGAGCLQTSENIPELGLGSVAAFCGSFPP